MNAPTAAQLVAARRLFRAAYLAFVGDDAAFWRTLTPGQRVTVDAFVDDLGRAGGAA